MPKTKRAPAAAAEQPPAKQGRADGPAGGKLLFSPGASGRATPACAAMLQKLSDRLGAGLELLGKGQPALAAACKAATGRVILVGASNGCRQICQLLAAGGAPSGLVPRAVFLCTAPAPSARRAAPAGFPLHAATPPGITTCNDPQRQKELDCLPDSVRVLFVSGANDEFLHRDRLKARARGAAALRAGLTKARRPDAPVLLVRGGGHSVPQRSRAAAKAGPSDAELEELLVSRLERFVSSGEAEREAAL
eukprot:TRINITY_DN8128_c0_g1_i2.p2 TRINITY_DN8128_c0_g1~~TRINITY_DN8128_c0_g1_i2.p2  ORF type:complete len:277 (+),score=107.22 TRINITY_DN8128_c0_g1_i2:84-833(+)